jgi:hypothetical protein
MSTTTIRQVVEDLPFNTVKVTDMFPENQRSARSEIGGAKACLDILHGYLVTDQQPNDDTVREHYPERIYGLSILD